MKQSLAKRKKEAVQALQDDYRSYRRAVLLMIGILLLAFALVFFRKYLPALLILGAAVLLQLLYVRRLRKRYSEAVTEKNLYFTVCALLHSEQLPEKRGGAGITEETVRAAGLLPVDRRPGAVGLYEGIRGSHGKIKLSVCDITLAESYRLVKKGRNRVFENCGCWIHAELPEDSGYDFRLFAENAIPAVMQKEFYEGRTELHQLPASELGLPASFYCFLGGEKKRPPVSFAKDFERLQGYTTGYLALSLRGSRADIFIRNRFLSMPVAVGTAPTEESLCFDPLPELEKLLTLLERL